MKIVQCCDTSSPFPTSHSQIPVGMVYRYGDHACGPYLRIDGGSVDLRLNTYLTFAALGTFMSNYLPLPNARIVLT